MAQQTLVLVDKSKLGIRPRVAAAIRGLAQRAYTIGNLLSSDPKIAEVIFSARKTDAGIVVTAANAFTFSAVFDAVNQGSSDVGKLPLNLLSRRDDGGADHAVKEPAYQLLKFEANPEMSAMDMRQAMQAHAMTRKGAFAEIERDGAGRPFALWPITPDRVERKRDGAGTLYYLIDGKDPIPARDMLDIRGLGYDGITGYDVIDKARQAIGLALAAEKFGATFFGEGASFPGLLGFKGAIGPDNMDAVRKHLAEHGGRGSWHQFLALDNDPSFTSFGVDPEKAQMNELRTKQIEEVARFFNFPVHKLKNLDRATNNNIEQQSLEYLQGFLQNWTTKWEQELNRKLIPKQDRGRLFFKHNFNAFLRADTAARTALYMALLDRGVINADTVLELEDMNPQPDGLGKEYLVNGAMVPKKSLGTRAASTGAAASRSTNATDAPVAGANSSAVIAAHRTLIVDIMRRMIEREGERALRADTTEAKLRQWMDTFYDGFEELVGSALLPAVRVHIAWIESQDDPVQLSKRLAAEHVDESKRQLLVVLDGDADDLAVSVGALIRRWESERVSKIADQLMQREIAYAKA